MILKKEKIFLDILEHRRNHFSDKLAIKFLNNEENKNINSLSYDELTLIAKYVAFLLMEAECRGERILLMFNPGIYYCIGLLGSFLSGGIAVPVYPPRKKRRSTFLDAILLDSSPKIILCDSKTFANRALWEDQNDAFNNKIWLDLEKITKDFFNSPVSFDFDPPNLKPSDLIFLQYTSGSTSTPKGVMVTHENLIENQRLIKSTFGNTELSDHLFWVPLFHDMGLILNFLQSIYLGCKCYFMAPMDFLNDPLKWIINISEFKVHNASAPNFAYDLLVERYDPKRLIDLDLNTWKVAINAAEPVRAETLKNFLSIYQKYGLDHTSLNPAYGLAENTICVSGHDLDEDYKVIRLNKSALEIGEIEITDNAVGKDVCSVGSIKKIPIKVVDPESFVESNSNKVGEIWVSGPSVAVGYWQKEKQSNEVFSAKIKDKEELYLRTGDLGFINQGKLYITGRLKDLIIIRGKNFYPQDLELTSTKSAKSFKNCMSAAFSYQEKGNERVCIVQEVGRHTSKADYLELMAIIHKNILEKQNIFLSRIVLISKGRLPRTSSGKVQRKRTKALLKESELVFLANWENDDGEGRSIERNILSLDKLRTIPSARREFALSDFIRAWIESVVVNFGQKIIDENTSLEMLGLDSLQLTELVSFINLKLNLALQLHEIKQADSIKTLSCQLLKRIDFKTSEIKNENRFLILPKEEPVMASFEQERLWFTQAHSPENNSYNLCGEFKLSGSVDIEALQFSLKKITERHEVFNTRFSFQNGVLYQKIIKEGWNYSFEDLRDIKDVDQLRNSIFEIKRGVFETAFNLESDFLYRFNLLQKADKKFVLLICIHHIIFDGWSLGIFLEELSTCYNALVSGETIFLDETYLNYGSYSHFQRNEDVFFERSNLEFWKEALTASPTYLDFPADYLRPKVLSYKGKSLELKIECEIVKEISSLAEQMNTTLNGVFLSCYMFLLYKYSGQSTFVVGIPVANRTFDEFKKTIGFFVNTIALKENINPEKNLKDFIQGVDHKLSIALSNSHIPLNIILEELKVERDTSRHPLFQHVFSFQNTPKKSFEAKDLEVDFKQNYNNSSMFDLGMHLELDDSNLIGRVEYNTDIFNEITIRNLIKNFEHVLKSLKQKLKLSIASAGYFKIEDGRLEKLLNQDQDITIGENDNIVDSFRQTCLQYSDRIAVFDENDSLTYRELDKLSEILASNITDYSGQNIAVENSKTVDYIIAILAVLKAGAAYVPLDSKLSEGRMSFILEESDAKLVVGSSRTLNNKLSFKSIKKITYEEFGELNFKKKFYNSLSKDNIAYIMFTSGSSGRPKGVLIRHGGVLRLAHNSYLNISSDDRFIQFSSQSFDAATFEIWTSILNGASLYIPPTQLFTINQLCKLIERKSISVLWVTAGYLKQFSFADFKHLRRLKYFLSGGDVLPLSESIHAARIISGKFLNGYGPTENTTFTTVFELKPKGFKQSQVPIGLPIDNTSVYILDENLQECFYGVVGELYIGGEGLAAGYLNSEDFLTEIYINGSKKRLYPSGDLVKITFEGQIIFVGRKDRQLKIRGFRVGVEEIENALTALPGVKNATVLDSSHENHHDRLAAFISLLDQNRKTFRVPSANDFVTLVIDGISSQERIIELSVNGIQLQSSNHRLKLGSKVLLLTRVAGFKVDKIEGEVRWNNGKYVGIKFLSQVSPDDRKRFDAISSNKVKVTSFVRNRIEEGVLLNYSDSGVAIKIEPLALKKDEIVVVDFGDSFNLSAFLGLVVWKEESCYGLKLILRYNDEYIELLKQALRASLPDYMVPDFIGKLEEMPVTINGKINKNILLKDYFEKRANVNTDIIPQTSLEVALEEVWKNSLGIDSFNRSDNFFEIGGTSLKLIGLIRDLEELTKIEFSINDLLSSPSFEKLHDMVFERRLEKNLIDESIEIEAFSGDFDCVQDQQKKIKNILLTGATGFLGAFLLKQLLEFPVSKIYVPVRGENSEECLKKVKDNLQKYRIWEDRFESKIVPFAADLTKERIGLSFRAFENLSEEIDVIIHNGAYVNFVLPYQILKPANVNGTNELIRLALCKRKKEFHFISTVGVFDSPDFFGKTVSDGIDLCDVNDLHMGYNQSKLISEKTLRGVFNAGLRGFIHRPGRITGDSMKGDWNTADFTASFLKGCSFLGFAPELDMTLDFTPVDFVSKAISSFVFNNSNHSSGASFNYVNPKSIHWNQIINYMNSIGIGVELVPFANWLQKIKDEPIKELQNLQSLVPLFNQTPPISERYSVENKVCFDATLIENLSANGLKCEDDYKQLLNVYFSYFQQIGFIKK